MSKKLADLIDLNPSNEEVFEPLTITDVLAMEEESNSIITDLETAREEDQILYDSLESFETLMETADSFTSMEELDKEIFETFKTNYITACDTIGVECDMFGLESEETLSVEEAQGFVAKVKEWAMKIIEMIKKAINTIGTKIKGFYAKVLVMLSNDEKKSKALLEEFKKKVEELSGIDDNEDIKWGDASNWRLSNETRRQIYEGFAAMLAFDIIYPDIADPKNHVTFEVHGNLKSLDDVKIASAKYTLSDKEEWSKDLNKPLGIQEGEKGYMCAYNGASFDVLIATEEEGTIKDMRLIKRTFKGFLSGKRIATDFTTNGITNTTTYNFYTIKDYHINNLEQVAATLVATNKLIKDTYKKYDTNVKAIERLLSSTEAKLKEVTDEAAKTELNTKLKALQKVTSINGNLLYDQIIGMIKTNKNALKLCSYQSYNFKKVKDEEK